MKKLNRKGFTLIELLAVIVVLAIVLVVTIPSVLRSVNNARVKSLENSVNAVADWLTRQSELAAIADTGVADDKIDNTFKTLAIDNKATWDAADEYNDAVTLSDSLLKAAGFGGGTADATGKAWKSGSRICVELTPVEDTQNANGTTTKSNSRFKGVPAQKSAGC